MLLKIFSGYNYSVHLTILNQFYSTFIEKFTNSIKGYKLNKYLTTFKKTIVQLSQYTLKHKSMYVGQD